METLTDEILMKISELFDVDVKFSDDSDTGKVSATYNGDAIFSKMVSLFVYCGWTVPSYFAPSYNRVHADIEFWKKKLSAVPEDEPGKTEGA